MSVPGAPHTNDWRALFPKLACGPARSSRRFLLAAAAIGFLAAFAIAPAASAATSATHELTTNWVGSPANAQYGSTVIAEWHINTNDANNPQANDPVNNVRLTLTATNGAFSTIPSLC